VSIYQIDKYTGVGTNESFLTVGSDYECVDCYAVSPTAVADLAVTKTVSDATPGMNDAISYGLGVTNLGTSHATVVQVTDSLPSGVTYVSYTASQGTYDSGTGIWHVGNLSNGSSASLTLNVTVDTNPTGTTVMNTATVATGSGQPDPVLSNNTASVDFTISGVLISLGKTLVTVADPLNGATNPKSIPGAEVLYTISATNLGSAGTDSNTVVVSDAIPVNTELYVGDLVALGTGPVDFTDGAVTSGLSYAFTSLSSGTDDLAFSDDNGTTWAYTPVPDTDGYDATVTNLRLLPKGEFVAASGPGLPSFAMQFRVRVR